MLTDFSKLEEDAIKANKIQEDLVNTKPLPPPDAPTTVEEKLEQYKNMECDIEKLGEQMRLKEEKIRTLDKDKAEQFERLGMGANSMNKKSNVTHSSALSSRQFEKVNPTSKKGDMDMFSSSRGFGKNLDSLNDIENDMMLMDFTSRNSNKSRGGNVAKVNDEFWDAFDDKMVTTSPPAKKPQVKEFEGVQSLESKKLTTISGSGSSSRSTPSSGPSTTRQSPTSDYSDTQKKFAGAKSISSDQFFGNNESAPFENKANLSRFQGSDAISSDAFFNRENPRPRSTSAYTEAISSANLYDIKEGVKDGVSKVAGRLSSLATDVFSSLQDRYGGM